MAGLGYKNTTMAEDIAARNRAEARSDAWAREAEEKRRYESKTAEEKRRYDEDWVRSQANREDTQAHQIELWKMQNAPLVDIPGIPGGVGGEEGQEGIWPEKPEYDPRRAAAMTQSMVAPQKRNLRQAFTEATSDLGQIANPNIQAMTLQKALEGYGMSLESAMTGARGAAESQYKEMRKEEGWKADQQAKMMQNQYSALLSAWQSGKLGRVYEEGTV